jgi:hypothetical protein
MKSLVRVSFIVVMMLSLLLAVSCTSEKQQDDGHTAGVDNQSQD